MECSRSVECAGGGRTPPDHRSPGNQRAPEAARGTVGVRFAHRARSVPAPLPGWLAYFAWDPVVFARGARSTDRLQSNRPFGTGPAWRVEAETRETWAFSGKTGFRRWPRTMLLRQTITGLWQTITGLRQTITRLRQTITRLRQTITGLRQTITGLRQTITGLRQTTSGFRQTTSGLRQTTSGFRQFSTGLCAPAFPQRRSFPTTRLSLSSSPWA